LAECFPSKYWTQSSNSARWGKGGSKGKGKGRKRETTREGKERKEGKKLTISKLFY
jgi:hypothetical protein